jgi:hypothetical protein
MDFGDLYNMELEFVVQVDNSEPHYKVNVVNVDKNITVTCNCGKDATELCFHKITVLSCNPEFVISSNIKDLSTLASWLKNSDVGSAISSTKEVLKLLHNVRDAIDLLNSELSILEFELEGKRKIVERKKDEIKSKKDEKHMIDKLYKVERSKLIKALND